MNAPDTTLYLGPTIVIPLRAANGFDEEWEPGEVTFRSTCNGDTKVLAPSYRRKYSLTITGSGNGVWRTPSLDLIEPGTELVIDTKKWWTSRIAAGQTSCILSRVPVPGSVRVVRAEDDAPTESTLVTKTVTIGAPAETDLAVLWRMRLTVLAGKISGNTSAGLGGWTMEVMEKAAPA